MDANQLLFYLRGFFEMVPDPTGSQVAVLRSQILLAKPVVTESRGGCGCSEEKKKHQLLADRAQVHAQPPQL